MTNATVAPWECHRPRCGHDDAVHHGPNCVYVFNARAGGPDPELSDCVCDRECNEPGCKCSGFVEVTETTRGRI